jgi:hypothetical protein
MAGHRSVLHYDVFENLVKRMTDMNVAVGVGRAVVQDEVGLTLIRLEDSEISSFPFPSFNLLGFVLGQVPTHGKVGFR